MQYQSTRPDPKRDADAATLAEGAGQWATVTLNQPWGAFPVGSVFYVVPSRTTPGKTYLANGVACQCPDYQQRGAICAHVRAVRLVEARRQQQTEGSADEADPTPEGHQGRFDTREHEQAQRALITADSVAIAYAESIGWTDPARPCVRRCGAGLPAEWAGNLCASCAEATFARRRTAA